MKKKRASAKKRPKKEVNVNQIIHEADTAMEALDLDRAYSQYTAASKILREQIGVHQKNLLSRVLGNLGEVKVSLGDHDGARADFFAAVALLQNEDNNVAIHESRANLYLYLGQVSSEQEALVALRKGVEELEACIRLSEKSCEQKEIMEGGSTEQDALQEIRRQQSAAYCSIAELYLTDLCYEEDAEQECETAIQAALKIIDPADGEPLVDSLQTMASLRLSQRRAQEATKYVLEAYEKVKCGCEALSALVGLQKNDETRTQAVELVDVDAANNLPSFEFRCQSAKILLECAAALKEEHNEASKAPEQAVQCSDAAIQVLGSLLAENDEVIEVWYLMGCAFEAASDLDAAVQYWERTLEMLLKVKESMEMSSDDDEEQDELHDVNVQIENVRKKLEETGHEVDAMETDDVNMDS